MDSKELGKYYHLACENAHQELDALYEKLFDNNGNPVESQEKIVSILQSTTQRIRLELEIIKSSLQEFNESS
jgi:hypothetical protein